jgi:hypothetical protein
MFQNRMGDESRSQRPILLSGSAGAERASAATIASLRRTFSELLLTRFKVKKNTLALSGFERHLPCSHTT